MPFSHLIIQCLGRCLINYARENYKRDNQKKYQIKDTICYRKVTARVKRASTRKSVRVQIVKRRSSLFGCPKLYFISR